MLFPADNSQSELTSYSSSDARMKYQAASQFFENLEYSTKPGCFLFFWWRKPIITPEQFKELQSYRTNMTLLIDLGMKNKEISEVIQRFTKLSKDITDYLENAKVERTPTISKK